MLKLVNLEDLLFEKLRVFKGRYNGCPTQGIRIKNIPESFTTIRFSNSTHHSIYDHTYTIHIIEYQVCCLLIFY